jgi:hypothetical protein
MRIREYSKESNSEFSSLFSLILHLREKTRGASSSQGQALPPPIQSLTLQGPESQTKVMEQILQDPKILIDQLKELKCKGKTMNSF